MAVTTDGCYNGWLLQRTGGKTDGACSGWLLKRMAVILKRMAGTTDGGYNGFFITDIVYSGWAHTTGGGYSGYWLLRMSAMTDGGYSRWRPQNEAIRLFTQGEGRHYKIPVINRRARTLGASPGLFRCAGRLGD